MDKYITQLFTDYNDVIWLLFGFILVFGSVKNWDWLCDPTGKPHAPLMTRGLLRFIFFSLGLLLIGCSFYFLVKRF